jgi:hypothetical protein
MTDKGRFVCAKSGVYNREERNYGYERQALVFAKTTATGLVNRSRGRRPL